MAKKAVITNETLQEAKERVKKAFRPSDEDPIVRFIENGKMGLRHIFSEEVIEAPTKDYIEMPEAEVIPEAVWERDAIRQRCNRKMHDLLYQLGENYKYEYDGNEQYYPPFDNYQKFKEKESGKFGIVSDKGEIVIPPVYSDLNYMSWFDKKTHKQMYFTDILKMAMGKCDENYNRLYGYVRLDGTEVVPAKFPSGAAFKEVMKLNPPMSEIPEWGYRWLGSLFYYQDEQTGLWGFQTIKGEKVTEPISAYQPSMRGYVNGKRIFEIRRKGDYDDDEISGLIDETGKEILPCKYTKGEVHVREAENLIYARKKKKMGVFDLDGKPIVKCDYRCGCDLQDAGIISAYTKKDVTLFNRVGNIIIDKGQYDYIKTYSKDGLLFARDIDHKWWYIDLWGNRMPKIKFL
jgi:hypothetical protein